ncbi:phosphatidylinositol transfer protein vib isoform X1 [Dermacentor variabilis]|uniref:phosphatidylinositol transfer protein vib isoform X1 n=1 Tax=Dermacentor variabilis TaxID=34621 RepID=UPI003F5C775E
MIVKEFRVVLPITVEEYQVGQLYSVAEASKNETGGGEGIEVIKNEPFEGKDLLGGKFTKGQYTYKIYHLESKVPAFIRMLMPKGSLAVHEEAWNAYPYCRTVLTNPDYMASNFTICIETMHAPDNGSQENVHELPPEKLKIREVEIIDIASDPVMPRDGRRRHAGCGAGEDYKEDEDPSTFVSKKTGRGPLKGDWMKTCKPVMCAYKLVTAEFKWFGLQSRIEAYIQKTERRIFLNFHRQVFCWIDRWHGMTMADIRKLEEQTKKELDEQRKKGAVRGTKGEE